MAVLLEYFVIKCSNIVQEKLLLGQPIKTKFGWPFLKLNKIEVYKASKVVRGHAPHTQKNE